MMVFICLSGLNLVWLTLATLNAWRPITFERLDTLRMLYGYLVANLLVLIAGIRFMRSAQRPMLPDDLERIQTELFGYDDPVRMVQSMYRINQASFVLYEVLLCPFLL